MALEDQKDFADYKDEGYIELVLKILGLMCDGQNKILQVIFISIYNTVCIASILLPIYQFH